jgi:hypothetical protein
LNEEIPTREFIPKSGDESRCLDLAQKLGETDMRFILSALRRCGLSKVEEAYGVTMETKKVKDRRKYFNAIIGTFQKSKEKREKWGI